MVGHGGGSGKTVSWIFLGPDIRRCFVAGDVGSLRFFPTHVLFFLIFDWGSDRSYN